MSREEYKQGLGCGFTGGLILGAAIMALVLSIAGHPGSYKEGQIDALIGDIKYEVFEHPDKTKTWERVK